jgi:signal transduction histidine kinase
MEDHATPPMLREFFQHILTLAERAAAMTRQLLAFARQPPLWRQALPIEELILATADLVRRSLRSEVDLDLQPGPDGAPLLVEADVGQMQQALVNLALNAKDAQEGQAARMVFRLRHASLPNGRPAFPESVAPGEYVLLEVIDQGCGMTPEVLNQALDPFFTTKDVGRGTGLGLPVVFGIVRAHQGILTIESAPGQGTTVAIYLPPAKSK